VRVLTATSTTQGDRADDICFATPGELVALPVLECSCPDCGCDRSFTGLTSQRATTTCVVTDAPLDGDGLRREVVRSLAAAGWLVDLDPAAPPEVVETWADLHRLVEPPGADSLSALDRELVDDVVTRILEVAGSFPAGTVLARADGGVLVRRPATADVSG
jgi:hypothetical protein